MGSLLLVLSCSAKVPPPIGELREGLAPQQGGTLQVATYVDVRTLDPAKAYSTTDAAINNLIFETLVSYDEAGKLAPELAESFEVSPDGKTYRFHIRPGVRFHEGGTVTAEDVKRSLERMLAPETGSPAASYYERLEGYAEFHGGEAPSLSLDFAPATNEARRCEVSSAADSRMSADEASTATPSTLTPELLWSTHAMPSFAPGSGKPELRGARVVDPMTLELRLSEPDATFLYALAMDFAAVVCPSAGRAWSPEFSKSACGTGPFRLTELAHGQQVRLARNEAYWRPGLPYLDGVVWHLNMPKFTQRAKFETGALDTMREFEGMDAVLYRTDPAWKGIGHWEAPMTTFGVFMNTEVPPFDNVHVRRAVGFALDRDELALVREGNFVPQYKIVPEAIIPSEPGYPGQRHDTAQALEEMRLAGYAYDPATGTGGYPEEIVYLDVAGSDVALTTELIQQQLARIGLRVRLQLVGWPTFQAKSGQPKAVAMGRTGWHADFPEASTFFEPIFTSRAIGPEESQNVAFFRNDELDRLILEARSTSDEAARRRLYRRAEEIIADQVPWAITMNQRDFELTQPYVRNYRPNPAVDQDYRWVWLDIESRDAGLAKVRR